MAFFFHSHSAGWNQEWDFTAWNVYFQPAPCMRPTSTGSWHMLCKSLKFFLHVQRWLNSPYMYTVCSLQQTFFFYILGLSIPRPWCLSFFTTPSPPPLPPPILRLILASPPSHRHSHTYHAPTRTLSGTALFPWWRTCWAQQIGRSYTRSCFFSEWRLSAFLCSR